MFRLLVSVFVVAMLSFLTFASTPVDSCSKQTTSPEVTVQESCKTEPKKTQAPAKWAGKRLTRQLGTVMGPSGKETFYNLPMGNVIKTMRSLGYDYEYHIREDGVKMFGDYIMCAANLKLYPRGTLIETSLGTAIVCDTGHFAKRNARQIDIAVNW